VAEAENAIEAMSLLENTEVDLVFLDINMPKLSGINFVKSIKSLPNVVFITAYPEFAVEGFEVEAIDYLVKPVPFERFLKAVNKVKSITKSDQQEHIITIKADKRTYRINCEDILYIKSLGDYVQVVTSDKPLITNLTMKEMETMLDGSAMLRIHKSYIINLNRLKYLEGNQVKVADILLPVGATYREILKGRLDN
ncbi:MAG: LytTR family DNA-binding domain-containing protein, partial [Bacteroidota bacterium]